MSWWPLGEGERRATRQEVWRAALRIGAFLRARPRARRRRVVPAAALDRVGDRRARDASLRAGAEPGTADLPRGGGRLHPRRLPSKAAARARGVPQRDQRRTVAGLRAQRPARDTAVRRPEAMASLRGFFRTHGSTEMPTTTLGVCDSPDEVEDALSVHPAVADVATVAMPGRTPGEKGCAFVVPRDGGAIDLADIRPFLERTGLARQKFPEHLVLVDELPRGASGKVSKDVLRAQASEIAPAEARAVAQEAGA